MSRTRRIDQEIFDILARQFQAGKGVSRHATKQKGVFSAQSNRIHSKRTFQTYRQQGKAFAKWAREGGIRTLKDVDLSDVGRWLEDCQKAGNSPYTLKTRAAAMAKVLQCSSTDFGFVFSIRKSEEIRRSRGAVKMDARVDERKYADVITVAKGTGMRRVELQRLKAAQLEIREGRAYIVGIHGKGDLVRVAPVLKAHQDAMIAVFKRCGTEKVFPKSIPTCIDIHSYRGEYAKAMYDEILAARKAAGIPVTPDYHTRGNVKIAVNKATVKEVSKALGHQRIGVTITHYLKHQFA